MGIVYLATDSVLRRELAAKTITRLSDTAASRLISEAQAMAAFSHQHIAVLYGIERWRQTPILFMEYMTGGTLADRLRTGPLGEADALSIIRQLAVGLEEVHRRGLFHGDIKPSNIGFTGNGVAKFLDFGLAQFAVDLAKDADDNEDAATGTNIIAGTPAYMSPEVRDGAPRGPAMDVWALCVVLLETLIGEPPLRVPKRGSDIRDGVDRALKRIDTHVSSPLVDLLHKSLAPEARRYPANAHDLVQALIHLPRS
jgi:serine/threonine-protein kinase